VNLDDGKSGGSVLLSKPVREVSWVQPYWLLTRGEEKYNSIEGRRRGLQGGKGRNTIVLAMSQVTLIGFMKEKQAIGLISNFDVNYRGV
jgi:hypothetical protein